MLYTFLVFYVRSTCVAHAKLLDLITQKLVLQNIH
jgi:hypothetical protein